MGTTLRTKKERGISRRDVQEQLGNDELTLYRRPSIVYIRTQDSIYTGAYIASIVQGFSFPLRDHRDQRTYTCRPVSRLSLVFFQAI
jgi:hypothetical protein